MFMDEAVFGALAVRNRLRIVEALSNGPQPVGVLADRLDLRQPLVSSHLKVLSQVGLVRSQPRAQQRLYELRPEPFHDIQAWVSAFRTVWTERLDRMETQLREVRTSMDTQPTASATAPSTRRGGFWMSKQAAT